VEDTTGTKATLRVAVHELRTPLAVLRLLGGNLPEADRRLFEETVRHIDAVLAGLGGAHGRISPAPAEDVADAVTRMLGRLHPDRLIERSGRTVLLVDRHPVEEILINLLNNALRHSPGATPVKLRIGEDGGNVTMTVEDQGEGIPAAERELVFAEGYSTARSTGLGLGISRQIAESAGGRLDVLDSATGCRILLTIPALVA